QNQIISGVLTGYCCCIRPPAWIPQLNVFCAPTHDVTVRDHAIWCNDETSSGYCGLWFRRRAAAWRVLVYTDHDRSNSGSTIFHFDIGQQVLFVSILDLHRGRLGHAVHEFDGYISEWCLAVVGCRKGDQPRLSCLKPQSKLLPLPIQAFHLGLEIKIAQALLVPL